MACCSFNVALMLALFIAVPQALCCEPATCSCAQASGTTNMLPFGTPGTLGLALAKTLVNKVMSEACAVCWSITNILLPGLWPSPQENVWDEIKAQVKALIDESLYKQQMANLGDKLQSLKFSLESYSSLPEKNTQQGASQITSLLTNIESSLCEFANPAQLQADIDRAIGNGQFVYLAPFMNLHLSVMLERNKVYRALSPDQKNDENNKAEFLGAVNAYHALMSSSYEQNVNHRGQQISALSGKQSQGGETSNSHYYGFTDSLHGSLSCKTLIDWSQCVGRDMPVCRNGCYDNAQTVAQSCHDTWAKEHILNAKEFWVQTLLSPVNEWAGNARSLSSKILPDDVQAWQYDFAHVCGRLSGASVNATIMV